MGGVPGLDPGPGRRRRDLRRAGALVRRGRQQHHAVRGRALRPGGRGGHVVRQGARGEPRDDLQRRDRRTLRAADRGARADRASPGLFNLPVLRAIALVGAGGRHDDHGRAADRRGTPAVAARRASTPVAECAAAGVDRHERRGRRRGVRGRLVGRARHARMAGPARSSTPPRTRSGCGPGRSVQRLQSNLARVVPDASARDAAAADPRGGAVLPALLVRGLPAAEDEPRGDHRAGST